jgi:putative Ca2+/H+ antiporter (TMEM165/GDT1 family)
MEGGGASDELEEVEAELGKKEDGDPDDVEASTGRKELVRKRAPLLPPAFVQSFTLTFLAEWGDRSQIATIALAAAKDPFGVTLGGTIGHAMCTGLAVIGGRMLASRISERMVAIMGGVLFLIFAAVALIEGPDGAI